MAGNLTVIWRSKFAEYFNFEFTANFPERFKHPPFPN